MKFRLFTISVFDDLRMGELNSFLVQHRIYAVNKEFIKRGNENFWSFLIEYEGTVSEKSKPSFQSGNSKIDYKAILSEEDFVITLDYMVIVHSAYRLYV